MFKKLFIVFSLCLALFQVSCGKFSDALKRKPRGKTEVKFTTGNGPHSLAVANGGLMIYAVRADGSGGHSLALFNEDDFARMVLDDDAYIFYGAAFLGPNGLEGGTKCAVANGGNPIDLNGTPITVQLTYDTPTCKLGQDSLFGPAASSNAGGFLPLKFKLCLDYAGVGCSVDAGFSGSAHVILEEFIADDGGVTVQPDFVVDGCVNIAAGATPSSALNIPVGPTNPGMENLFLATVEIFDSAGCSGNFLGSYELDGGLSEDTVDTSMDIGTSAANTLYLYRFF